MDRLPNGQLPRWLVAWTKYWLLLNADRTGVTLVFYPLSDKFELTNTSKWHSLWWVLKVSLLLRWVLFYELSTFLFTGKRQILQHWDFKLILHCCFRDLACQWYGNKLICGFVLLRQRSFQSMKYPWLSYWKSNSYAVEFLYIITKKRGLLFWK